MYEAKKGGRDNIAISQKLAVLSNDFKVESAAPNI
jgi:hypothetical protein